MAAGLSWWDIMYGMEILVVDDDPAVRDSLDRVLSFNGYRVSVVDDGQEAVDLIHRRNPHLVILEATSPRIDGLAVCRRLRGEGHDRPILMLSELAGVSDRVAGLDAGADDYLAKPFALEELLARVRARFRRALAAPIEDRGGAGELALLDLRLNPDSREVRRGGRAIPLTRTEFSLLELLMRNSRRVLPRLTILEGVWGGGFPTSGNALEVYIGYLRRKTEAAGEPRLIHTVRGVGYVLREDKP